MPNEVRTTCAYCGVGCGIRARVTDVDQRQVQIEGDKLHPANLGRLCSKGSALGETLHLEGRCLHPRIQGKRASWKEATRFIADRFNALIADGGPEQIGMYLSGQLLTEDYYVANKLMKGFIGSANVDTNSRLCMSSAVAGHKRTFGEDLVPACYEDLEIADLLILAGANLAWCHPVLHQRVLAARAANPDKRLVVIDPRRTASCDGADLHLQIRPGTDALLFSGVLLIMQARRRIDNAFVASCTFGLEDILAETCRAFTALYLELTGAQPGDELSEDQVLQVLESHCDLPLDELNTFLTLVEQQPRMTTVFSMGINQASNGTDKVNSITNLHLALGRIGKPGAAPFSMTGQPNAMGGREVGGLSNQLAAHLPFNEAGMAALGEFWQAPNMVKGPGLPAVDLFDAVYDGRIKAIWIMGTNPVVSLPNADRIKAALQRCPLVIVSECIQDSATAAYADVLLPATGWGEKDGTVTNSERRISRQRAFLPAAGEARPDWWALASVARDMGHEDAFDYDSSHEIFSEHARLSGHAQGEDGLGRVFDISQLGELSAEVYDALEPKQWPLPARSESATPDDVSRLCSSQWLLSHRAEIVSLGSLIAPAEVTSPSRLRLNTGRIRDQWHTMTRTGLAPRLNRHIDEPFVAIHISDAASRDIQSGDCVRLSNNWGDAVVKAQISADGRPGELFMPMHWSEQFARRSGCNALVAPLVDPVSAQPDNKGSSVDVTRIPRAEVSWRGFVVSKVKLPLPEMPYAARIRCEGGYRLELAGTEAQWLDLERNLNATDPATIESNDSFRGDVRRICLQDGQLIYASFRCLMKDAGPNRLFLESALLRTHETQDEVLTLLAGRASDGIDCGAIVCACLSVGERTLEAAVLDGAQTVNALSLATRAGTNCGSCLPELKRFL
ncbi:molybdopterin-dependent oxidoreductase [Allohahella sp. A8]|uniref:nitrate reductase n=1 Tax=Allohahella sp. A8 TaxID=3141461 RepID=UPI003A813BA9